MESLFGIPTFQIALGLALLTLATLVGIAGIALRGHVLVRLGARHLPRRPLRSLVIVVGLALSRGFTSTAVPDGHALVPIRL